MIAVQIVLSRSFIRFVVEREVVALLFTCTKIGCPAAKLPRSKKSSQGLLRSGHVRDRHVAAGAGASVELAFLSASRKFVGHLPHPNNNA
jgi:hypothetical protein